MNKRRIQLFLILITFLLPVLLLAQFGKGDILFKIEKKNVNDVLFSHKVHSGFEHITCEYCHNVLMKPYIDSARKKKEKVSEVIDKLFCNNCHNGEKVFSTDNELNCKRCHSIIKEKKKNGKEISN